MKYVFFVILFCFVVGCQSYHDRPLDPNQTLTDYQSRSLGQPGLTAFLQSTFPDRSWPPESWDVAALTAVSFYYHPELAVFRARLGIAQSDIASASQYPNPVLSLTPAFNSTTPSDAGISSWIVDSALDFSFQTAGKRDLRIAETQALAQAARLELAQAAWSLRSQIRTALIDLYQAGQLQELLASYCQLQQQTVNHFQALQELGAVTPLDTYRERTALQAAELDRLQAQKQQALALDALAQAMGLPGPALAEVPIRLDWRQSLPALLPDQTVRRKALMNRADLMALLAKYQAAQLALQLEIANQYPDLTIGPGYSFDQSENKWALGLSLALPVFNRNQAAIAGAQQRRSEAAAEFIALQADIVHAIDRASENYRISLQQLAAASALVVEQEQKIALQNKMQAVGEISPQEVLTSRLELNQNRRMVLQARIAAQQALGQMEDAMQSPSEFPNWQETLLPSEYQVRGHQ